MAPKLRANLVSALICLVASLSLGTWTTRWWLWFIAGLIWAQLAEYAWHRFVLHGPSSASRLQHADHHKAFLRVPAVPLDDLEAQDSIPEERAVFPVALAAHAAVFVFLSGGLSAPFFVALCIHYMAFELSHWAIHVRDNPIDLILRHVPLVRRVRAWQILYHFEHHEDPRLNFGFTPPFTGDVLLGTRRNE